MSKALQVRLTDQEHQAFVAWCGEADLSVSAALRQLMRASVNSHLDPITFLADLAALDQRERG